MLLILNIVELKYHQAQGNRSIKANFYIRPPWEPAKYTNVLLLFSLIIIELLITSELRKSKQNELQSENICLYHSLLFRSKRIAKDTMLLSVHKLCPDLQFVKSKKTVDLFSFYASIKGVLLCFHLRKKNF